VLAKRRLAAHHAGDDGGFGLVELLIAITVLLVGVLAVFLMFESGIITIKRASTRTTASALADAQLESFRAIKYDSIGLVEADVLLAPTPYSTDPAYAANPLNRVGLLPCGVAPCTTKVPVQTLAGADGKNYRVDTFVTWQTVTGGRNVKRVTIVVRDATTTSTTYARVASLFDASTGV
jgi:Tfp pilus assembly protein PilV